MQQTLFPEQEGGGPKKKRDSAAVPVEPAAADSDLTALAAELPSNLYLGTASWNYPGWTGLVWARDYPEAALSRHGLPAYAAHSLFRTVSLDRGFYRPLTVEQFAGYAAQVPDDFRFMVKAPSLVADAVRRDSSGRGTRPNPHFLDAGTALREFVEPAVSGLGDKIGVLIFQISPLPASWIPRVPEWIDRLHAMLRALSTLRSAVPQAAVAVEVRNPEWLIRPFVEALRDAGASYCMALHAKMPLIEDQLDVLRALWPGPLVCRWNLNPVHGAFGYEDAQQAYAPYDRMVDPDPQTRAALARAIAGTVGAGQAAYVSVSNKAEGCAPRSVVELAKAVRDTMRAKQP